VVWQKNLVKDYGKIKLLWGYSASPLLIDERLFISVIHQGGPSYLLCLDAASGKELWKVDRRDKATGESRDSYSSPVPLTVAGRQAVVVAGADIVTCHAAEDGSELWRFAYHPKSMRSGRLVPTVVIDEGVLVGMGAKSRGSYAYDVSGPTPQKLWADDGHTPDVASSVLADGLLYVLNGERKHLTCCEARTRKELWQVKLGGRGPYWASPTLVDGKLYCINTDGDARVVSAGGDGGKLLASFRLEGGKALSTPAVVDGTVLVRVGQALLCAGGK
jgi:outer membrane protein assembly factor BamB